MTGALTVGSEFSGAGLLDFGLHLAGFEHVWGCEADEWRRERIWRQRFPGVPCYADIRDLRGADFVRPDVIAGGFPCKGASTAGKRTGFGHPETVLWREMRRTISEVEPRYVLIENVANILGLHGGAVWGEVLADLAALGFDAVWDCLPAAAVGAPHRRDRVFAVAAHPSRIRERAAADEADAEPGDGVARCVVGGGGGGTSANTVGGTPQLRGERGVVDCSGRADEGEAPERQRGRNAARDRAEAASNAERERGGPEGNGHQVGGRTPADPQVGLVDAIRLLPTPAANDGKADLKCSSTAFGATLEESLLTGPRSAGQSSAGRPSTDLRLSPWFVEWMMGAPAGWTDPDCPLSATEFASMWGRSPGSSSSGSSEAR